MWHGLCVYLGATVYYRKIRRLRGPKRAHLGTREDAPLVPKPFSTAQGDEVVNETAAWSLRHNDLSRIFGDAGEAQA